MKKENILTVDEILNNINYGEIPSISNIINKSGIKVMLFGGKMTNNIMSLIALDDLKRSYNIYIRKNLCYKTQRFLAAYTYFYIGLYYDNDIMYKAHYDEELYDKSAYRQALRVLMPEKMFIEDIESAISIKKLEKKYQVSSYLITERANLIEKDKEKVKFKVLNGKKV